MSLRELIPLLLKLEKQLLKLLLFYLKLIMILPIFLVKGLVIIFESLNVLPIFFTFPLQMNNFLIYISEFLVKLLSILYLVV